MADKKELSKEDLEYLEKNTQLKKNQIEEAAKEFYDLAPDGKLTRQKFTSTLKDQQNTERYLNLVFNAIDTNNSNSLDLKEYIMLIAMNKAGTPDQQFKFLYRMYDLNHDGKITKKELSRAMKIAAGGGIIPQVDEKDFANYMDEYFKIMDENSDNGISQDEFVKACTELLKATKLKASVAATAAKSIDAHDLEYILKNTRLSKDEVNTLANEFYQMAPDGKLTRKNFTSTLKDKDNSERYLNLVFNAMDSNHDNSLDVKEFVILSSVAKSTTPEEQYGFLYKMYDLNHDGKVTRKELQRALRIAAESQHAKQDESSLEKKLDEYFEALDLNKDNTVTQQEFVQACIKLSDEKKKAEEEKKGAGEEKKGAEEEKK